MVWFSSLQCIHLIHNFRRLRYNSCFDVVFSSFVFTHETWKTHFIYQLSTFTVAWTLVIKKKCFYHHWWYHRKQLFALAYWKGQVVWHCGSFVKLKRRGCGTFYTPDSEAINTMALTAFCFTVLRWPTSWWTVLPIPPRTVLTACPQQDELAVNHTGSIN